MPNLSTGSELVEFDSHQLTITLSSVVATPKSVEFEPGAASYYINGFT
jgi:hypothetical protein